MNTSGQFGIGNTAPQYTLDVNGTSRFANSLVLTGGVNALGDQGGMVPNGGFEVLKAGTTNMAESWTASVGGTSYVMATGTSATQGDYAQGLSVGTSIANTSITSTCIAVGTTNTYQIRADVRSSVTTTRGTNISVINFTSAANCVANSGTTAIGTVYSNQAGSTAWTRDVGGAYAIPNSYTWIKVLLANSAPNTATGSTLFFDAVRVIPSVTTTGLDYAENYPTTATNPPQPGELVTLLASPTGNNSLVVRTTSAYQNPLIGIVSTEPGYTLDDAGNYTKVTVALAGRVPLKVSTENGPIMIGDRLVASSTPGVAMKGTHAGYSVGTAMEKYDNTDPTAIGSVITFINNTYFEPTATLTAEGQVDLDASINPTILADLGYQLTPTSTTNQYTIKDSMGKLVDSISTSFISAKTLVTKLTISDTSISKETKTAVISPLSDISDTITINGSASISGNLDVAATLTSKDASISGTLFADNIISKDGSLSDVMNAKVSSLRTELQSIIANAVTNNLAATVGVTTPVTTDPSWLSSISSDSATIAGDLQLDGNMVITSKLAVMGDASFTNAYVSGTFTAGQIALRDNIIETTATALYLQPSKTGSVHIMGDTLVIADTGDVTINGNLTLNGTLATQKISTSDLFANQIVAASASISGELTAGKINIATDSATPIIATSSFSQLATSSAQLASNATAGTITLSAGMTEMIIHNTKVTPNSMVYLTPTGSTNNQVVYVKNKVTTPTPTVPATASASASPLSDSYFTIALDTPLTKDVAINWWIIN